MCSRRAPLRMTTAHPATLPSAPFPA